MKDLISKMTMQFGAPNNTDLIDPYDDCPEDIWMPFEGDYATYIKFHAFHTDGEIVDWIMDYKEVPRSYCLTSEGNYSIAWMKSFFRDIEEGENYIKYRDLEEKWADERCKELKENLSKELIEADFVHYQKHIAEKDKK